VAVVCGHKGNGEFPAHLHKTLVYLFLDHHPVLLELQKEISLAKGVLIVTGRIKGLVHLVIYYLLGNVTL